MSASLSIVADQQILLAEQLLSELGNVKLVNGRAIDREMIKDADALLVRSVTHVNQALLEGSTIRFVGSATSGIDHIDTDYLKKSNIHFEHAPGSNARSVAEYVLSSLFVTAEYNNLELTGKTVGIIGCGQVGSRVKRFMETLGISCLINDPLLAEQDSTGDYVDLDRIAEADVITLHVPLTMDGKYPTYKLINESFLEKLKSDVILINTARGEVVDEAALLSFKRANMTATLILDVWCNEPNIDINLLQQTFIGTPHIAGYSYDGKLKATRMLARFLMSETHNRLEDLSNLATEAECHAFEYDDDNAIQLAVMQAYDIRSDAMTLKELVEMPIEQRAKYFDSLRKDYPKRREFTQRRINTKNMSHAMQKQFSGLGFKTEAI